MIDHTPLDIAETVRSRTRKGNVFVRVYKSAYFVILFKFFDCTVFCALCFLQTPLNCAKSITQDKNFIA
eukprot:TRINITY_DN447_c1_g2_i1.p1 TRINITY_DN447_c1_g2~~TRINITY_DN447_c1_g2_i1.p1  ORF type:complete len:69 (+),score=2.12 TRINITY_DN447_c1_g2_i1:162-368(+)